MEDDKFVKEEPLKNLERDLVIKETADAINFLLADTAEISELAEWSNSLNDSLKYIERHGERGVGVARDNSTRCIQHAIRARIKADPALYEEYIQAGRKMLQRSLARQKAAEKWQNLKYRLGWLRIRLSYLSLG
jgi:hypothetical protein